MTGSAIVGFFLLVVALVGAWFVRVGVEAMQRGRK